MPKAIKQLLQTLGLLNAALSFRRTLRAGKFIRSNLHYWRNGARDGCPLPSLKLVELVTGSPDLHWFLQSGAQAAESIRSVLHKNGSDIAACDSILDFGCGCGRVIRHFKGLGALCGTDFNAQLIEWCKKHLRFAEFRLNSLEPPLGFSDTNFDLIYALSVFTHLPEKLQFDWITEFWRLLRPHGLLLFSTHGDFYLNQLTEKERKMFRSGQLVIKEEGTVGSNRFNAYHPRDYVEQKLIAGFERIDFEAQGAKGNPYQDLYLFRKLS